MLLSSTQRPVLANSVYRSSKSRKCNVIGTSSTSRSQPVIPAVSELSIVNLDSCNFVTALNLLGEQNPSRCCRSPKELRSLYSSVGETLLWFYARIVSLLVRRVNVMIAGQATAILCSAAVAVTCIYGVGRI